MADFKQNWRINEKGKDSISIKVLLRCIPDIDALFKVNMKSVIGKN